MTVIITSIHRHTTIIKMEESRDAYRVLVGRPEGHKPLGRPRYVWEDGTKTDIREVRLEGMDFIPGKFWVPI
jgi:hypothetical protein